MSETYPTEDGSSDYAARSGKLWRYAAYTAIRIVSSLFSLATGASLAMRHGFRWDHAITSIVASYRSSIYPIEEALFGSLFSALHLTLTENAKDVLTIFGLAFFAARAESAFRDRLPLQRNLYRVWKKTLEHAQPWKWDNGESEHRNASGMFGRLAPSFGFLMYVAFLLITVAIFAPLMWWYLFRSDDFLQLDIVRQNDVPIGNLLLTDKLFPAIDHLPSTYVAILYFAFSLTYVLTLFIFFRRVRKHGAKGTAELFLLAILICMTAVIFISAFFLILLFVCSGAVGVLLGIVVEAMVAAVVALSFLILLVFISPIVAWRTSLLTLALFSTLMCADYGIEHPGIYQQLVAKIMSSPKGTTLPGKITQIR